MSASSAQQRSRKELRLVRVRVMLRCAEQVNFFCAMSCSGQFWLQKEAGQG